MPRVCCDRARNRVSKPRSLCVVELKENILLIPVSQSSELHVTPGLPNRPFVCDELHWLTSESTPRRRDRKRSAPDLNTKRSECILLRVYHSALSLQRSLVNKSRRGGHRCNCATKFCQPARGCNQCISSEKWTKSAHSTILISLCS